MSRLQSQSFAQRVESCLYSGITEYPPENPALGVRTLASRGAGERHPVAWVGQVASMAAQDGVAASAALRFAWHTLRARTRVSQRSHLTPSPGWTT